MLPSDLRSNNPFDVSDGDGKCFDPSTSAHLEPDCPSLSRSGSLGLLHSELLDKVAAASTHLHDFLDCAFAWGVLHVQFGVL